jgi:hypothetical protein
MMLGAEPVAAELNFDSPQGSSCRIVKTVTVLKPPIRVLGTKSNSWHDIAFRVQGGGVVRAYV